MKMSILPWQLRLPVLLLLLFAVSCKKNPSASREPEQSEQQGPKFSGVLSDDPALVQKAPLITTLSAALNGKGKPPKGGNTTPADTSTSNNPQPTTPPPAGSDSVIIISPPALPSSYSLQMPPVRNQGTEGSCVSFAVAYAARSCEEYYRSGSSQYSDALNIFSPEYVFNQVRSSADCSGSAVVNSLELLKTQGVCTWELMPYSSSNGCSVMPGNTQISAAAKYRISSYSKIVYTDETAIKTMISSKHPVIASFNIDQNFYNASPGFIWKSYAGFAGSHTMALCGYDDARHAYKAINSWGTGWGDAGYIWIDYDFFPTVASYYCYVISL